MKNYLQYIHNSLIYTIFITSAIFMIMLNINMNINNIFLNEYIYYYMEYSLYLITLLFIFKIVLLIHNISYKFSYIQYTYEKYKYIHSNKYTFIIELLIYVCLCMFLVWNLSNMSYIIFSFLIFIIINNIIFYKRIIKGNNFSSIEEFKNYLIHKKIFKESIEYKHFLNILFIIIAYTFICIEYRNSLINSEFMNTINDEEYVSSDCK